jgi:hypothetical protein
VKRTRDDFLLLISELEADVELLQELKIKNRRASDRIQGDRADELDWAALGYTLHNLYNLLENYFLRIAKFFENALDSTTWHRDLVERMSLSIEGVRPSLLSRSEAAGIDELRAFRHVFRNIYQSTLDPARVRLVQDRLSAILAGFEAAHSRFVEKMRSLADHFEE